MSEPGCRATIVAVWQQVCTDPVGESDKKKKINTCGKRLTEWSKTCF